MVLLLPKLQLLDQSDLVAVIAQVRHLSRSMAPPETALRCQLPHIIRSSYALSSASGSGCDKVPPVVAHR